MCESVQQKLGHTKTYLWEILGQWDILLLNFISIGFTILFRCLIFNCYNISICKKEKLKDEAFNKIHEANGSQIKEQDVPLT